MSSFNQKRVPHNENDQIQSFWAINNTTNVKNMHLHRDSNPGPWNTVNMSNQLTTVINS